MSCAAKGSCWVLSKATAGSEVRPCPRIVRSWPGATYVSAKKLAPLATQVTVEGGASKLTCRTRVPWKRTPEKSGAILDRHVKRAVGEQCGGRPDDRSHTLSLRGATLESVR